MARQSVIFRTCVCPIQQWMTGQCTCRGRHGRTKKRGHHHLTRTEHIRAMMNCLCERAKHYDPVGYRVFLERAPLSFVTWMLNRETTAMFNRPPLRAGG